MLTRILQDSDDDKAVILAKNCKRAWSAGTSTTGVEHRNVRRISAGEGMSSMAMSMNTAADTLANAMCEAATTLRPALSTPQPTNVEGSANISIAIALIESNEGLSDNEFGDAAQCITTNPSIAAVYVSMKDKSARSRYIRKQVDSLRGIGTEL